MDLDLPLVSIVMPIFNAVLHCEKNIQQAISITKNNKNIEFILIDGGSTDGTVEIIEKYAHSIDYWISEKDSGVYDAMNKGILASRGDWIYFLGSDDFILDGFTKNKYFFKDLNTIYYGDVYLPSVNKLYCGELRGYKLIFKNICHQAIFYPRSIFNKYKYEIEFKILADHVLNLKCMNDPDFKTLYIPTLVCIYNDEYGLSFSGVDNIFEQQRGNLVRKNYSYIKYLIFILHILIYRIKIYLKGKFK